MYLVAAKTQDIIFVKIALVVIVVLRPKNQHWKINEVHGSMSEIYRLILGVFIQVLKV